MSVYKALLVEDEFWAMVNLRDKLKNFPEIEIIGEAKNITEAKKLISEKNPHVIFLDIQLKDGTGFDLLNEVEYNGKIIFVTAFDEHAIRAFEINALDYIMKPISEKRLGNAIKRIHLTNVPVKDEPPEKFNNDDRIMVSHKNYINFIRISEILLISSAQDYTSVRTTQMKDYLVLRTMNEWEERLPENSFCRIHRSHIINFNFIEKTHKLSSNSADIYLKGFEEPFKVSKNYYQRMKQKYLK